MPYTKPIPSPSPQTKEFWEGAKAGKLMLPRCTDCNRVHWYPRLICPHCHSMDLEWIEASGEGRIHTFAVQHRAMGPWAEEAPFVTASHGTEADPVFNYANRAALALFETTWTDFTSMPSRLSAEPVAREERAQLLARVNQRGFIDDYSGIRISTSGRHFRIRRATVWNVVDTRAAPRGQAVVFRDWEYL